MRRAMAEAEVGDDVFGDDPTVQALERRIAELTGKEAALYVPSGTMGNQLGVHCLTQRGDEVMLEICSHIMLYEQGGIAANSGCLAHVLHGTRGVISAADIEAAWRDAADEHIARMSLLCLENTHNRAGGAIVPLEAMRAATATARSHGMRIHLDGARLWNTSVATGIPIAVWAECADTVMMCFSKALGAPVGSILAGPRDVVRQARRVRKRWGGGMRQVGILAAACLHAIDHHIVRLAGDHARARRLAQGFAEHPGVTVTPPDTNIVFVELDHAALDPAAILAALRAEGVWMSRYGPRLLRAVLHLDVDDAGVDRALAAFRHAVAPATAAR